MEKYIQLAKELRMIDAMIVTPKQIFFDIRAILKCRWGCEYSLQENIKCNFRDTIYQERVEMVKRYRHILLLHCHDDRAISEAVLHIERGGLPGRLLFRLRNQGMSFMREVCC